MILVGELINMTRKPVEQAWKDRDEEAIASLARTQAGAGADYIDVNSGVPGEEAAWGGSSTSFRRRLICR
jgi:cobalamin-dependent methionine synthase I